MTDGDLSTRFSATAMRFEESREYKDVRQISMTGALDQRTLASNVLSMVEKEGYDPGRVTVRWRLEVSTLAWRCPIDLESEGRDDDEVSRLREFWLRAVNMADARGEHVFFFDLREPQNP